MKITITRDSVAMGDDVHAPHERVIEIDSPSMEAFCQKIWEIDYLPMVDGATAWLLMGTEPLAVLVKKGRFPPRLELSVDDDRFRNELVSANYHLHFAYRFSESWDSLKARFNREKRE